MLKMTYGKADTQVKFTASFTTLLTIKEEEVGLNEYSYLMSAKLHLRRLILI